MILQEILSPVSGFKCVYQKDFTKEIKHRLRGLRSVLETTPPPDC